MYNKILFIITIIITLSATKVPLEKSKIVTIQNSLDVNSQIIQLNSAKQNIMSQISGHIIRYYVKPAQQIKEGDKIVEISSIKLSQMSSQYLSLKKQYNTISKNFDSSQKLYKKGMISQTEFNNIDIQKSQIDSQLKTLQSQLQLLDIDIATLKTPISNYTLYAHSSGEISKIIQPIHSSITPQEPLITIIQNSAYYIKLFIPFKYASSIKINQKIVAHYNSIKIASHITQIIPTLDTKSQQIIALAVVDKTPQRLFINSFIPTTIYFGEGKKYISIKKSALSRFLNEWVVFVPNHHEEDEHHDEHEEAEFKPIVVEIIRENNQYIAIRGLELNQEYVSDKSYYVKSMLLKSSLGGHGH